MNLHITTDRLILRPFSLDDARRVRALAGDIEVAQNCAAVPHPYPEGAAEAWIAQHDQGRASSQGYPFGITVGGELIGCISLEDSGNSEFDLGYWLGRDHWNQGYATEAARAVLAFGFDTLAIRYVRAGFITQNTGSRRVLAKVGFLATHRCRRFHAVRQTEVEITRVVLPWNAFIRDDKTQEQVYKAA